MITDWRVPPPDAPRKLIEPAAEPRKLSLKVARELLEIALRPFQPWRYRK